MFTVRAFGTVTDILTTTVGALVRDSSCGGDTSDELDAGARAQLSGRAGGWRLVEGPIR